VANHFENQYYFIVRETISEKLFNIIDSDFPFEHDMILKYTIEDNLMY